MDATFMKIGEVIRNSETKNSYHPLLINRNLIDKEKQKPNIATFDIIIDVDNNNIDISKAETIPDSLKILKFRLSSATNNGLSHLIGSDFIKRPKDVKTGKSLSEEVRKQFSFNSFNEKYLKDYSNILTPETFIYKYRVLIENNIDDIINAVSEYDNNMNIEEIAFNMKIVFNGKTDVAHAFNECIDSIDEMFLLKCYVEKHGYTFLFAFYGMFNYGKFETNGVKTMYDDSIPYYSKEEFLNLYYAKAIYDTTSFMFGDYSVSSFKFGDYSVSIFPNCDNLQINDIEDLIFKGNDIFNFDLVCDKIQNVINRHVERNSKEKTLMPTLLNFNVYYRYKSKAGIQNILKLSGIRYNQLLNIRKHINNEYYPMWKDNNGNFKKRGLYYILTDLYRDYNGKSDRYVNTILHTLQNIYQEKYVVSQTAEFCLLDRTEHLARMGKSGVRNNWEFENTWNELFNNYKFLKTMENQKFVPELISDTSYKLGTELAKFEAGWKDDRENLKNFIKQFTGNISRTVYGIEDVQNYYQSLVERMIRNNIKFYEHNDLISYLKTITDNEFNKNKFTMGYYSEKNQYKINKSVNS